MGRRGQFLVLALSLWLAMPLAAPAQVEDEELYAEQFLEEEPAEVSRPTIVPWEVTVLGKNFDHFTNDDASSVLNEWLLNSLIELKVFTVVNRDKMQAMLSELQLAAAGYAEISRDAMAEAGKHLKVDYILCGNFKNLGKTSEIDFKLLDVDTATYSHPINLQIPFNAGIESMKPEIDRIVAQLAAKFPIVAQIGQIVDDRRVIVGAGTADGVSDAMEAEIWTFDGAGPHASGFVVSVWERQAEIELEQGFPGLNLFDHLVHIKIVPPAQAALTKGLRDLRGGDFETAARTFRKGLEADPDDGLLHANYASSLWQMGDRGAAVAAYRKALDLRPDDVELLEDAAEAMLASGHTEELIVELEQGSRRTASSRLSLAYGAAQETLGHFDRAVEAYRWTISGDPNAAEAHLRLAVLAAKRGQAAEAQREFGLAQRKPVDSLEYRLTAASFALVTAAESGAAAGDDGAAAGDDGAAAGTEVPGRKSAGGDARALEALADRAVSENDLSALTTASEVLLLDETHWRLSLDLARRTLELNPGYVRASVAAARAHAAGGENAAAVALLDDALADYPNNAAMVLLSAELLEAENDLVEAESRYRRAAELAPGDWSAPVALGDLYSSRQDYLKATGAYLDALERAEASGDKKLVPHLHRLGTAAVQAQQLDTARPYLERCVAQAPDDLECQFYLGLCYLADETPPSDERALACFGAASELADSHYYLGTLHQRQASFDQALGWFRSCVNEADCHFQQQSQRQVDLIESISGTVTQRKEDGKKVVLDVGRIHGVTHGREGVVVLGSRLVAKIKAEEVREETCVAVVSKGDPLIGQTVRFRPTSVKGVRVRPHAKKGVVVSWRANAEPEVDHYVVFAGPSVSGPWQQKRKVRHPDHEYVDRSVKPGQKVFFKVVAVSETKSRSPDSRVVETES